jgi:hypothetical protein
MGLATGPGAVRCCCDVLGFESANRGLNRDESLNAYGNELEALIATLGLDELAQV